jgi:hypothetical protein
MDPGALLHGRSAKRNRVILIGKNETEDSRRRALATSTRAAGENCVEGAVKRKARLVCFAEFLSGSVLRDQCPIAADRVVAMVNHG